MVRVVVMNAVDYCDLCDLPRSQCIHGQPPRVPAAATKAPARKRSAPVKRSVPDRVVTRRWSPPEAFRPLILAVLEQAGGELENDDMFLELEIVAGDTLLSGDRDKTPEGEERWRYAARRARVALISEGVMTKSKPGFWQLAPPG
ncbi:MAG: hypothetical protein JWQ32_461 [Marmoricola sp.]|nr:hypothetical protein [Marmoricola sp.]